jgi:endonuclease/exonuclease/phosphatase family metal-dependent hydrolase
VEKYTNKQHDPGTPPTKPTDAIRVLTQNVWHEEVRRPERLALLGRVAQALQIDVLLLQEVPCGDSAHHLESLLQSGFELASSTTEHSLGNAVLTRLNFQTAPPIRYTVPESLSDQLAAATLVRTPMGRDALCVSTHLIWSGHLEHRRLLQADAIDRGITRYVGDTSIPVVLGGDFNCLPTSSTARFLTGIEPYQGHTAQWVDVWDVVGQGAGITSSAQNSWAREVAERHGFLDPYALPDRRIDRLMVRGYAHGRVLSPIQAFVLDETYLKHYSDSFPPSDHWGVVADLWDPPQTSSLD